MMRRTLLLAVLAAASSVLLLSPGALAQGVVCTNPSDPAAVRSDCEAAFASVLTAGELARASYFCAANTDQSGNRLCAVTLAPEDSRPETIGDQPCNPRFFDLTDDVSVVDTGFNALRTPLACSGTDAHAFSCHNCFKECPSANGGGSTSTLGNDWDFEEGARFSVVYSQIEESTAVSATLTGVLFNVGRPEARLQVDVEFSDFTRNSPVNPHFECDVTEAHSSWRYFDTVTGTLSTLASDSNPLMAGMTIDIAKKDQTPMQVGYGRAHGKGASGGDDEDDLGFSTWIRFVGLTIPFGEDGCSVAAPVGDDVPATHVIDFNTVLEPVCTLEAVPRIGGGCVPGMSQAELRAECADLFAPLLTEDELGRAEFKCVEDGKCGVLVSPEDLPPDSVDEGSCAAIRSRPVAPVAGTFKFDLADNFYAHDTQGGCGSSTPHAMACEECFGCMRGMLHKDWHFHDIDSEYGPATFDVERDAMGSIVSAHLKGVLYNNRAHNAKLTVDVTFTDYQSSNDMPHFECGVVSAHDSWRYFNELEGTLCTTPLTDGTYNEADFDNNYTNPLEMGLCISIGKKNSKPMQVGRGRAHLKGGSEDDLGFSTWFKFLDTLVAVDSSGPSYEAPVSCSVSAPVGPETFTSNVMDFNVVLEPRCCVVYEEDPVDPIRACEEGMPQDELRDLCQEKFAGLLSEAELSRAEYKCIRVADEIGECGLLVAPEDLTTGSVDDGSCAAIKSRPDSEFGPGVEFLYSVDDSYVAEDTQGGCKASNPHAYSCKGCFDCGDGNDGLGLANDWLWVRNGDGASTARLDVSRDDSGVITEARLTGQVYNAGWPEAVLDVDVMYYEYLGSEFESPHLECGILEAHETWRYFLKTKGELCVAESDGNPLLAGMCFYVIHKTKAAPVSIGRGRAHLKDGDDEDMGLAGWIKAKEVRLPLGTADDTGATCSITRKRGKPINKKMDFNIELRPRCCIHAKEIII